MGSQAWDGYAELRQALEGLACAKGTSATRIKAVANAAFKYVKSQIKFGAKDQFTKRFALHLTNTIAAVKKIPEESQNPRSESSETTPSASAGKLASLLSIIKKQKERKDQQETTGSILGDGQPSALLPSPHGPKSQQDRRSPTGRPFDRGDNHGHQHRQSDSSEHGDRRRSGLLPDPTAASGQVRREFDRGADAYDASRNVKKPRGSRWGPPKAPVAGEDVRPPPINTAIPRSDDLPPRYAGLSSRSPPRRTDALQQAGLLRPSPSGQYPPRTEEWRQAPNTADPHAAGPPRTHHDFPRSPPPSDKLRQPSPGGRVGYGYDKDAFHDNNRFAHGPNAAYPPPASGRLDERQQQMQPHPSTLSNGSSSGEKIPGTSGEVCRKFASGRCTFGDRCWHIHDQQAAKTMRPRVEMNEAKRKTVLCANFPKGACRFGDNCSFAHGEHDLDRSAPHSSSAPKFRGLPQAPGNASFDPSASRWQAPAVRPGGSNDSTTGSAPPPRHQQQASMSSANAYDRPPPPPPQQNKPFGTTGMSPHAVYNEVQGDRGNSGASSMSHPNVPVSGGPQYPPYPYNNNNNAAAAAGAGAGKDAFAGGPPGPPGGYGQPPRGYPVVGGLSAANVPPHGAMPGPPSFAQLPPQLDSAPKYPPPPQLAANASTGGPSGNAARVKDDDDEAETEAPEFNLQYDDED